MLLRFLSCVLAILCSANIASAQALPIANPVDTSGNVLKEWKVSYDDNELWPKLHYKKRPVTAIRLQIVYKGGKHLGQLWLFTGNLGSYSKYGKTSQFELEIDNNTSGNARKRIGFSAKKIDLTLETGGTKKISLNGVWQPGRDTTKREHERIQLKINHTPTLIASSAAQVPSPLQAPSGKPLHGAAPAPGGNCEDDPDTDVLEEGSPPGSSPDDPPTEP